MKLQLALDAISLETSITILDQIYTGIDIIEAGTPFILRYGESCVRALKERYPDVEVLCDAKIMDAGAFESEGFMKAGGDWVTVMAFTDDATIRDCVQTVHSYGKRVMADLLCVADIPKRAAELEALGVDCIAVHTGVDQQAMGGTPLEDLRILKGALKQKMAAVAGGISLKSLDAYLQLNPDILIVGGGILNSRDIVETTFAFRRRIDAHQNR